MQKIKEIIQELRSDIESCRMEIAGGNDLNVDDSLEKLNELENYLYDSFKQQIIDAANNGCNVGLCYIDSPRDGIKYWEKTYQNDRPPKI